MGNKKRNVLKHGTKAKEVMLWSESYADFEALRAALYQEFYPSGSSEEYPVRTLLDLRWRRQRLECHEQIILQQRLKKIRAQNQRSHQIEDLRSFGPTFAEATSIEQVETALASIIPLYSNTIRSKWPFKDGDDLQKWGTAIAEGLLTWQKPAPRYEEAGEFTTTFDFDEFDISLTRIERLDAMIKRLMQLKTMKQMYNRLETKLIDVSATKNLVAPDATESPLTP